MSNTPGRAPTAQSLEGLEKALAEAQRRSAVLTGKAEQARQGIASAVRELRGLGVEIPSKPTVTQVVELAERAEARALERVRVLKAQAEAAVANAERAVNGGRDA